MRSRTTSDEQFLHELTGAAQRWLATCRGAVAARSAGDLLAPDSREARVLVEQARSSWAEAEIPPVMDVDDLLADEPVAVAAAEDVNPEYSAAQALAALARGLSGAESVPSACARFLRHTERAGLRSIGSLLMAAGTPATASGGLSAEVVFELLRASDAPSRGYGVLMALELTGQRPARLAESRTSVAFSSFLAEGRVGEIGTLRLELLADGPSGLHPDPARMQFLRTDRAFTDGLSAAWSSSGLLLGGACVVWAIEMDSGAPANSVRGGSMAAAFAVALDDLAPRSRYLRSLRPHRVDPKCVVSAGLSGQSLTAVGGLPHKISAAQAKQMRIVVASEDYEDLSRSGTFLHSVSPAGTIGEAIRATRTKVNRRLYATLALIIALAATAVFMGAEAWGNRTRLVAERTASHARMMDAAAAGLRTSDSALAQQFALAAYRTDDTVESRSRLLETTATDTPIRIRGDQARLAVAATPDGLVVTGGTERTVSLTRFEGPHPVELAKFRADFAVNDIAVSTDEKLLALIGPRGLSLWDIADTANIFRLAVLSAGSFDSVAFSPDSRHLAAGLRGDLFTEQGVLRWDVTDGRRPTPEQKLAMTHAYLEVSYSHDGKTLAAGGHGGVLRLWDLAANVKDPPVVLERAPHGVGDRIYGLAFAPNADVLAVSSTLGGIEIVRRDNIQWGEARLIADYKGNNIVRGLAFALDGQQIAGVGSDRTTRVWRLDDPGEPVVWRSPAISDDVAFTAAGSFVVTGAEDGYLRLWPMDRPVLRGAVGDYYENSPRGRRLPTLPPLADAAAAAVRTHPGVRTRTVVFGASSNVAVTRDVFGTTELIDISDPERPQVYWTMRTPLSMTLADSVKFGPGEKLMAALYGLSSITVWDVSNPRNPLPYAAKSLPLPVVTNTLSFSESGLLAVGTTDGAIHLFDTSRRGTLTELAKLSIGEAPVKVAFAGNTGILAVGSGPEIALFDISDPSAPRDLAVRVAGPRQWDMIGTLAFTADGSMMAATGGNSGTIRLWQMVNPHRPVEHATLDSGGARGLGVSFTRHGHFLAVTGFAELGGGLTMWETDPESVVDRVCRSGTAAIDAEEWRHYLADIPQRSVC